MYYFFQMFKSYILYKPLCLKFGFKSIIYKPIKITEKTLEIGEKVYIYKNCRIEGLTKYMNVKFDPLIIINDKVSIQQNLHLTCAKQIEIGKNTAIANNVTITDIIHPYEDIGIAPEFQMIEFDEVKIGANCKVYNNVVILPGVKLGKHNIVAANSVVKKGKYADYSVIAGAPARIVKRFCITDNIWKKTKPNGDFHEE